MSFQDIMKRFLRKSCNVRASGSVTTSAAKPLPTFTPLCIIVHKEGVAAQDTPCSECDERAATESVGELPYGGESDSKLSVIQLNMLESIPHDASTPIEVAYWNTWGKRYYENN